MAAYYNEIDPFAAAWLRELIKAGQIADGEVDERSIADVRPDDLRGFRQCHFFAGIGGWSLALRLAGWLDDRPVWTGSCPCQPFSSAGAQAGGDDPRHLWPTWFGLIRECRPSVVFGEQVESAIAHGWLDLVCDDLEGEGYAAGAAGLPAASVGGFHIRQRLWFVAESTRGGLQRRGNGPDSASTAGPSGELAGPGDALCVVADALPAGRPERGASAGARPATRRGGAGDVADPDGRQSKHGDIQRGGQHGLRTDDRCIDGAEGEPERAEGHMAHAGRSGPSQQWGERHEPARPTAPSFWGDAEWLPCADGKARPVEPGTFPLAHGIPARVGRLRGYGNAIIPQVAAAFIDAYLG